MQLMYTSQLEAKFGELTSPLPATRSNTHPFIPPSKPADKPRLVLDRNSSSSSIDSDPSQLIMHHIPRLILYNTFKIFFPCHSSTCCVGTRTRTKMHQCCRAKGKREMRRLPTPRPPGMHCMKTFLEYKEEVKRAVMQAQVVWVSFVFHALPNAMLCKVGQRKLV